MITLSWQQVANALANEAVGTRVSIQKHLIEHPCDGGLAPTIGMPAGQRASFAACLRDGAIICVDDFGRHYDVRLERPRPLAPPPAPPARATAEGLVVGLAAAGALFGLAVGKSRDSALTGALVGGIAGLAGVAVADAERSPATSGAAVDVLNALVGAIDNVPLSASRRAPPATKSVDKALPAAKARAVAAMSRARAAALKDTARSLKRPSR